MALSYFSLHANYLKNIITRVARARNVVITFITKSWAHPQKSKSSIVVVSCNSSTQEVEAVDQKVKLGSTPRDFKARLG